MTLFTVFMIFIIAICETAVLSVVAFMSGCVCVNRKQDEWIKKQANRVCDRMLKKNIGKTLAGVNEDLSDIVNLINRRAIQWGYDITCIEAKR